MPPNVKKIIVQSKFQLWVNRYPNRGAEIYGALMGLGLIAFFLIGYSFGFAHTLVFRVLNFPILLAGVYYAVKQSGKTTNGIRYSRGFKIGLVSSMIAISVFALFVFLVFTMDHSFYVAAVKARPADLHMNTFIAAFVYWLEGVFTGFLITFLLMCFCIKSVDNQMRILWK